MRLRLQLVIAAAVGVAALVMALGMTTIGANAARTGSAAAGTPTPGGTISDVISPSVRASGPPLNTSPFPPGPPGNVTATRVTSTSVTLSWTAPTELGCCGVDSYLVYYLNPFSDLIWEQNVGRVTT